MWQTGGGEITLWLGADPCVVTDAGAGSTTDAPGFPGSSTCSMTLAAGCAEAGDIATATLAAIAMSVAIVSICIYTCLSTVP